MSELRHAKVVDLPDVPGYEVLFSDWNASHATDETDTSLVLHPDGNGGVAFGAAETVPIAANSVVGPDAFGASAAHGTAATFSRSDHDHGLPSAPAVPTPASTVTGPDAYGASAVVGTGTTYARADHNHGLPAAPTVPLASWGSRW